MLYPKVSNKRSRTQWGANNILSEALENNENRGYHNLPPYPQ